MKTRLPGWMRFVAAGGHKFFTPGFTPIGGHVVEFRSRFTHVHPAILLRTMLRDPCISRT